MRKAVLALLCIVAALMGGCVSASAAGATTTTRSAWAIEHSGTKQRLFDVACLSAMRCEAVGAAGTILGTANGGRTWHAQANPAQRAAKDVYRIACVAPSTCYAIARPDTILVTRNGGATWRAHLLSIPGVGTGNTAPGCQLPTPVPGQTVPCQIGLLDLACTGSQVCYAVATSPAGYSIAPKPPGSTVWITRDGGSHWARQSLPPTLTCAVGDCGNGVFAYPLTWVTCLNSGLCRAGGELFLRCGHCGFLYTVFAAKGPGAPWKLLTCLSQAGTCGSGYSPDAADCPTATRCYGVTSLTPFDGDNGIFWSVNAGATWPGSRGVQLPQVDIACPSARICYTAGNGGSVFRTTNGSAFTSDRTPTRANLNGITCVTWTACYAVGDHGTILARRLSGRQSCDHRSQRGDVPVSPSPGWVTDRAGRGMHAAVLGEA